MGTVDLTFTNVESSFLANVLTFAKSKFAKYADFGTRKR